MKLCGLREKKMVIDTLEDLHKFEDDEDINENLITSVVDCVYFHVLESPKRLNVR